MVPTGTTNSARFASTEPLMQTEPQWIQTAKQVLEETNRAAEQSQENQEDTKPLEIALTRQKLTLLKHQNIILGLIVAALESTDVNPNYIGPNAGKAAKLIRESGLYDL